MGLGRALNLRSLDCRRTSSGPRMRMRMSETVGSQRKHGVVLSAPMGKVIHVFALRSLLTQCVGGRGQGEDEEMFTLPV